LRLAASWGDAWGWAACRCRRQRHAWRGSRTEEAYVVTRVNRVGWQQTRAGSIDPQRKSLQSGRGNLSGSTWNPGPLPLLPDETRRGEIPWQACSQHSPVLPRVGVKRAGRGQGTALPLVSGTAFNPALYFAPREVSAEQSVIDWLTWRYVNYITVCQHHGFSTLLIVSVNLALRELLRFWPAYPAFGVLGYHMLASPAYISRPVILVLGAASLDQMWFLLRGNSFLDIIKYI
jgi:hypothetical protein